MKPLTTRDKRAVVAMVVSAVVICGYFWVVEPIQEDYRQLKQRQAGLEKKLEQVYSISDAKEQSQQRAVWKMVPVFEMPAGSDAQWILFRDEVTKQLKQCGVKAKSISPARKKGVRDGYTVLTLECQGKCPTDSMKRLVQELKKNPYYVGVEKLVMKVDGKDRNQVNFTLVVSTYAKG